MFQLQYTNLFYNKCISNDWIFLFIQKRFSDNMQSCSSSPCLSSWTNILPCVYVYMIKLIHRPSDYMKLSVTMVTMIILLKQELHKYI